MKKRVFALSMTAATSAFADNGNLPSFPQDEKPVEIYGHASVSVDAVNNGSAAATQGTTAYKVSSDSSYLGLKGAANLDDGLKAVWQVESLVTLNGSGTDTLGSRNSYAGLNHASLGTLLAGRYDTPYKLATRRLDVFGQTLADNRSLLGGVPGTSAFIGFDGRPAHTLDYISQPYHGFSVAAAYVAGAEQASASNQTRGAIWSAAAWYDAAPFYASAAYETHRLGSPATGTLAGAAAGTYAGAGATESAAKLGLGYTLGGFALNAAYERTRDTLGGAGAPASLGAPAAVAGANVYGHAAWYLGARYTFGANALKAAYARAGKLAGAAPGSDTRAAQLALGYERTLNRHATLYALCTRLYNGANVRYALSSASIASGATPASANGADVSAVSLGFAYGF